MIHRKFYQTLHDAWFAPADPRPLAIARILIFYYVWPGSEKAEMVSLAQLREVIWFPISTFKLLGIGAPSLAQAPVIEIVLWISSLLALVGFLFPLTSLVAAITNLYALGLPQNFGKIDHSNLIALIPIILAFSRAADIWSIDSLWKRRVKPASWSGEYRWPLAFIGTLVIVMYGAAGWSKLMKTGWAWALSDSFRRLLLRHHFTGEPPTRLGVWIAHYPPLCKILALGSMGLELSMPLGLFSTRARKILIPSCALLQIGIWLTLGVLFRMMIPIFLCLLPWQPLLDRIDRKVAVIKGLGEPTTP